MLSSIFEEWARRVAIYQSVSAPAAAAALVVVVVHTEARVDSVRSGRADPKMDTIQFRFENTKRCASVSERVKEANGWAWRRESEGETRE